MALDAQSSAFDRDLRREIAAALDQVSVLSTEPVEAPDELVFSTSAFAQQPSEKLLELIRQEDAGLINIRLSDFGDREDEIRDAWRDAMESVFDPENAHDILADGFVGLDERSQACIITDLVLNDATDFLFEAAAEMDEP